MALEFNFDIDAQIERLAKVPKTIRLAVVSGFLYVWFAAVRAVPGVRRRKAAARRGAP